MLAKFLKTQNLLQKSEYKKTILVLILFESNSLKLFFKSFYRQMIESQRKNKSVSIWFKIGVGVLWLKKIRKVFLFGDVCFSRVVHKMIIFVDFHKKTLFLINHSFASFSPILANFSCIF